MKERKHILICGGGMSKFQAELLLASLDLRSHGQTVAVHHGRNIGKSILEEAIDASSFSEAAELSIPDPIGKEPEPKTPKNRGPQPRRAFPVPR